MSQITISTTDLILQPTAAGRPAESDGEFAGRLATASHEAAPRATRQAGGDSADPAEADSRDHAVGNDVKQDKQTSEEGSERPPEEDSPVVVEIVVAVEQDTVEISEEIVSAANLIDQDGQQEPEGDAPAEETTITATTETQATEQPTDTAPTLLVEADAATGTNTQAEGESAEPDTQGLTIRADHAEGTSEQSQQGAAEQVAKATPAVPAEGQAEQAPEQPDAEAEQASTPRSAKTAEGDHRGGSAGEHPQRESAEQPGAGARQQAATESAFQEASAEILGARDASDSETETARPAPHAADTRAEQPAPRSLDRIAGGRFNPTRQTEAPGESQAARVDASRFVSRVGRAFESAHARGDTVRLRLSPPELGAMQIKLSISTEGAMHASVETETTAARNVMLDNLPALKDRLAQMDIRVEKFDVNVQQDGAGQQDWRPGEGDDSGESQSGTGEGQTPREETAPSKTTDATPDTGLIGPDQINLVA